MMRLRPIRCLLATAFAWSAASTAFAAPPLTRLIPSGGTSVHFVVQVPEARFPATAPSAPVRLELDGYELTGEPGNPALPIRVITVAVPPVGEVQVRAHSAEGATRGDVLLAPMPRLEGARGEEVEREIRFPHAYASHAGADQPRAHLVGVGWLRNQRVARVEISPAAYDAGARRLILASSIDVTVDVVGASSEGLPAESDDPFESVYRGALVNYEQGRAWRRTPPTGNRGAGTATNPFEVRNLSGVPQTTVYAGRMWVKLAVAQTGFYRVYFSQVRNTALFNGSTTTPADSLRLFTWPGVPVLPEKSYCDSCDYREVGIAVSSGVQFKDPTNYFDFFALGPSDWTNFYDPAQGDTVFLDNPYEAKSYYYLTIDNSNTPLPGAPKRIGQSSGAVSGSPATTPATFPERVHFEQDYEYWPDATPLRAPQNMFWEKWMWQSLSSGSAFATTFGLPGADLTQSMRLRLRAWGLASYDTCQFDLGQPNHILDVALNASPLNTLQWDREIGTTLDTTLTGRFQISGNQLVLTDRFIPQCRLRDDRSAIAWFDVFYPRIFEAANGELSFSSPPAADNYVFAIDSMRTTESNTLVFDVTDAYSPVQVMVSSANFTAQAAGRWRLTFEQSQTGLRRYRVFQSTSVVRLPDANIADSRLISLGVGEINTNLRSTTLGADFIAIYYDGFKTAADSLIAWRQVRLPVDRPGPYRTIAVPISALYDQFSGGRTDPAAIRNFLRATFYNWTPPRPSFVTFVGDASYDFKNLTGHAPSGQPGTLVPSYENGYDPGVFGGRQFASDDWILNVDNANFIVPDFFGGRIPVNDQSTALLYVRNKLLFYERSAPLGEYRNRIMFIADDNIQAAEPAGRDPLEWTHLKQTATLDNNATPNHIDRKYVYLHKYPDGPGDTKPGAKADIKKNLAEGVAMFNYIGHGSPFKITDESVFLDVDAGTLTNADMLPLFVAASCDVGKYNDPAVQSLGERLITQPGGGAIGVISATELALSSQNSTLNQTVYRIIFGRDSVGGSGQYHASVAAGLLQAKLSANQTTPKYQLMGDAAIRLNLPKLWAEITLWDSAGTALLTEVKRGQTMTFKGRVLTRPGGPQVSYSGVASLLIEDSAPLEIPPPCPGLGCEQPSYYYKAGPIFRGDVQAAGGAFQGRFVVPLEAALGDHGRIRAYLEGQAVGDGYLSDGVGSVQTLVSSGSSVTSDNTGPRITLSFVGGATSVRPNAQLRVDLFDQSGILLTGHSLQNGIVVTIDDNTTTRVDITASFRYAADSYQSGFALFTLPNLSPGHHKVQVSAADNFAAGLGAGNHRSSATLEFDVVANPSLNVTRAYLFPDPTSSGGARSGGTFVVDAPGDSVNVLFRMYTVTGRVIRTYRVPGGIGQVQIAWDGFDENGDRLANGVYLFKVYVYGRQSDGTSSATQRAISEGRFVILNR